MSFRSNSYMLWLMTGLALGCTVSSAAVTKKGEPMPANTFKLSSPNFIHNQLIPTTYTCHGEDRSPALQWTGAPADTKSFALICFDPDAPGATWIHWILYDIPPLVHGLPEEIKNGEMLANGAKHGMTSFKKLGYGGPCPPSGTHHYHFDLFALNTVFHNKPAGLTEAQLRDAMKGHILAQTRLTGLYKKS